MDYKDLYDAVDRMDDFTDDYYNTKTDNKYLSMENDALKEDNDILVGGIRQLNRTARRRHRYPKENLQSNCQSQGCNNQEQNNQQQMKQGMCCPFNFNFTKIITGVGVLFIIFLALGITPDTTISWASTKDMWIEFICDPYKLTLVVALILIYKNKKVQ